MLILMNFEFEWSRTSREENRPSYSLIKDDAPTRDQKDAKKDISQCKGVANGYLR